MLKLFVGDNTQELADRANLRFNSVLITSSNYKQLIQQSKTQDIVGHTSFADMDKITQDKAPFYQLLESAQEIVYQPPDVWSDASEDYSLHSMQRITEYYLADIHRRFATVSGLDLGKWNDKKYLRLVEKRSTPMKQLWITGCSCSHAIGVSSEQRYGALLSKKLTIPVAYLTSPGSSIEWSADQILRSNIQSQDIVVWGLTSEYRAFEWHADHVRHINTYHFSASESGNLAVVSEENRLFKSLLAVKQVENFCAKVGARLVMFPIIASETLKLYLNTSNNYFATDYAPAFVDLGTDAVHPGPEQHKNWANFLYNHI